MIKVIVIDDHKLFIDGLINSFENDDTIEIIGYALNCSSGLDKILRYSPTLVILDISFTNTRENGVDLLKEIKKRNLNVKTLILTSYCDQSLIGQLQKEGAEGYLVKNIGIIELKKAIIEIAEGEIIFKHNSRFFQERDEVMIPKISERAIEIIRLLASGNIVKEISFKLGIAESTVNDHIERSRKKLDVKNNSELVYFAVKNNLI